MYIIASFLFLGLLSHSNGVYLPNVECDKYVDYIPTNPNYIYNPMVVELHRCHGKHYQVNPHNRRCLPTSEGIKVIDVTVLDKRGQIKYIKMENHTECQQKCVLTRQNCTKYEILDQNECICKCNNTGIGTCSAPLQWDRLACDCTCQKEVKCSVNKEFSKTECGCTCKAASIIECSKKQKVLNKDTCLCDEPVVVAKQQSNCAGGVNGTMLAVIILVEFFFIIFCYYFFYVYCYKHNYLGRKYDKTNSGYYNGDAQEQTGKQNSGSYNVSHFNYGNDKERIQQEEQEQLVEPNYAHIGQELQGDRNGGLNYYHSSVDEKGEEKSPLNSNNDDDYYMYNGIMQVDGPPPGRDVIHLDTHLPPEYSDCASDITSEGYGSVTQV